MLPGASLGGGIRPLVGAFECALSLVADLVRKLVCDVFQLLPDGYEPYGFEDTTVFVSVSSSSSSCRWYGFSRF